MKFFVGRGSSKDLIFCSKSENLSVRSLSNWLWTGNWSLWKAFCQVTGERRFSEKEMRIRLQAQAVLEEAAAVIKESTYQE
jgi:hypothetical protein